MFNDLIIRVKTREFQLYNDYFSFFHSNSINKILTSKKIDQVILYRDLQFLDDQTEYLKRAYYETQAFNRIKKLISYYEKNMTPPSPLLLTVQQYQYLDNRNRKILKLCIMKEKSQGQKEKRKSFIQSNALKASNTSAIADILPKLDDTNLENNADSQRDQTDEESYDSDVHDVFENFKEKARPLFADGADNTVVEYKDVLGIRSIRESQLVINFKTTNEPPSDFNNCQNQPKIVVSSPPTVAGLKFTSNKANKQLQTNPAQQKKTIHQQESYRQQQSYPNQQSNNQAGFYPQQNQQGNQHVYQHGYQNHAQIHQNGQQHGQNYQNVQTPIFQQQNQPLQFQNHSNYQMSTQNISQQRVQDQNQFPPGYSSNKQNINDFQTLQKSTSPKRPPNYPHQQSSTASNSSGGHTFSSMMQNSSNNSMGGNFNFQNNGLSSMANNVNSITNANSATSPSNKKGKLSFMEYYHSVPNKNPTNILEKYMKRKK